MIKSTPLKIYYKKANSSDFWKDHWKKSSDRGSLADYYQNCKNNSILMKIFEKHLPRNGRILEAGCGLASWVYLLEQKGYNIEGIDFAKDTIDFVKSNFPKLPIKTGNVFYLGYLDNSLSAYISWGVVEHFEKGPEKILEEASRVLKRNGVMILSIPYLNPLRRVKNLLGYYKNQKGDFYQYLFSKNEIIEYIKKAGFEIKKSYPYNPIKGLKEDVFGMRKVHQSVAKRQNNYKKQKSLLRIFINSYPMKFLFSHSIVIIAEKQ